MLIKFVTFAQKIIYFYLLQYLTYLLQISDVCIFSLLKLNYKKP